MSRMSDVTDPNKLTKAQLFDELTELGVIDIPAKKSRKKELVAAYLKHISGDGYSATTSTKEITSETSQQIKEAQVDSIYRTTGDNRPLQNLTMPSKQTEPPPEITLMSNLELANALRERGVDVGPIIATTRKVYERKLASLLRGGEQSASASEEESMEQDPYEEEEEEEPEAEPVVVPKVTRYIEATETIRQRPPIRESYTQEQYTNQSYNSSSAKSSASSSSEKLQPQNEAPKAKGMSFIVKFIIFLVLAGLVFLVVVNMESSQPKPSALTGDPEAGQANT